ncbi:unnamed protein product [Moneuplotes crassus]|uniref:Uncharacterized protein n=1 Tax=Euplotes crassus TaxID=5936 RepID=A0AAD1UD04_EUPCR|nr:unnamed protein product [Moneuplotes crassus]
MRNQDIAEFLGQEFSSEDNPLSDPVQTENNNEETGFNSLWELKQQSLIKTILDQVQIMIEDNNKDKTQEIDNVVLKQVEVYHASRDFLDSHRLKERINRELGQIAIDHDKMKTKFNELSLVHNKVKNLSSRIGPIESFIKSKTGDTFTKDPTALKYTNEEISKRLRDLESSYNQEITKINTLIKQQKHEFSGFQKCFREFISQSSLELSKIPILNLKNPETEDINRSLTQPNATSHFSSKILTPNTKSQKITLTSKRDCSVKARYYTTNLSTSKTIDNTAPSS